MNEDSDTFQCIFTHNFTFIFKINSLDVVLAQILIYKGFYIHMSLNYELSKNGISCILNRHQMSNVRELGVDGDAL